MARDRGIIGEAVARISSKRTMTLKFFDAHASTIRFSCLPARTVLAVLSFLSGTARHLDLTSAPRERAMHWLYMQLTRAESIATGGW
jgi:hypothetical protein